MAEVKRPKLISFGCERVNDNNKKEVPKTIRISVVLSESTEDSFPEINYQDELLAVKKRNFKSPPRQTNGLDPFNEDDEDVKRIAAQMEQKYGMGVTKKRKNRKDDFADIGMGYDESDSFIDNTDGYDEIIPKNVTAVHGGFYINCGALEFKTDEAASSDSSSSDNETEDKMANRKRVIESSAASEDEAPNTEKSELPEKKQKVVLGLNGLQKALKKRLFNHEKIKQIRKRRNSESKRTVRELLNERRIDSNASPPNGVDIPENIDLVLSSSENRKTPDSVDNVIESVINAVTKKDELCKDDIIKEVILENISKDVVVSNPLVNHVPEVEHSNGFVAPKSPVEYVQLPENLPSDIAEIIDHIKSAAACSTEGKVKFFTENVNLLLLNLERKCRCLGRRSRIKVYEHLAPFVKCRKETLIKRAKNLVIIEETKKIKMLLDKLTAIVNVTMPPILRTYEDESKLVLQKKFSDDDLNKNLRMPKRHYPWTEDTKKLLRDIVTLRRKCFLNEGKLKESLEQNLNSFLKSEVQIIWPEGWVSMNTLIKYSNLARDKKMIDSSKKSSNGSGAVLDFKNNSHSSAPHISISSSSGLTIIPVTATTTKTSFVNSKSSTSVTPSETIITRINSDSNPTKTNIVTPPIPPDIVKTPSQSEFTNIKYSNSSLYLASNDEEHQIHNLLHKEEHSNTKNENILQDKPKPENEDVAIINRMTVKKQEVVAEKIDIVHSDIVKQATSVKTLSPTNVIDLTDQPELVRKPGPRSITKYYPSEYSDGSIKSRKDSTSADEECSGTSALNKIITDSLSSDLNKTVHQSHHVGLSNSHSNSVMTDHTYDYSKPKTSLNDYCNNKSSDLSKIKSTSDMLKMKSSSDYSKIKTSATDLSKTKSSVSDASKIRTSTNDLSKIKTSVNDLSKIKTSVNDLPKTKSSSEYSRTKSVSEGDDIQKVMEGLMVLQKMSSPVKPKEEARAGSAVSVINYNKSYPHDSRQGLTSSAPSTTNSVHRRNSSFQDAFQKQFIPDFNLMKATQGFPPKPTYNSFPKYNHHTSPKSNSSSSDSYLQNSNNIYPSQTKVKSMSSVSPQSVGSYNLLDDMYTNFLNEYGHTRAAHSKPSSTHQK